jgi:Flp pilus assembly protein TadB
LIDYLLCGVALAFGLVCLVLFFVGTPDDAPGAPSRLALRARTVWFGGTGVPTPQMVRRRRIQLTLAAVGGPAGWLASGIPLAVLIVPALVFVIPWFLASTSSHDGPIVRLEALAEWTQRLSDRLVAGGGLEQVIATSRSTAPAALENEINDLSGRLVARWRLEDALRVLGDDLSDATADKVLAALVLRANDHGPGLAQALTDLAASVREEVRQRRAIEADRAKHRVTVRWLTVIILVVVVAGSFDRSYIRPYSTVTGELVLTGVGIAMVAVVAWMQSMASQRPVPRFLEPDRRSTVRTPASAAPAALPGAGPTADQGKDGER